MCGGAMKVADLYGTTSPLDKVLKMNLPSKDETAVERDKITRPPMHPGIFFERNILPEFRRQNRTIGEIVALLGLSRQSLYRVMSGEQPITPDTAVRLGKLCGNGPDLWLNMQARYDAWKA
jgi:addiction module HigA family antidote